MTGHGFLAAFDRPARAIQCGCAIRDGARQIGLDVRVGVHTGEVELRGLELSGIAVHIATRVCEAAEASKVLVSRTAGDLVAGAGLDFEERGEHELMGISGVWRFNAVGLPELRLRHVAAERGGCEHAHERPENGNRRVAGSYDGGGTLRHEICRIVER